MEEKLSFVVCSACWYRWAAMHSSDTDVKELECPQCGKMASLPTQQTKPIKLKGGDLNAILQ